MSKSVGQRVDDLPQKLYELPVIGIRDSTIAVLAAGKSFFKLVRQPLEVLFVGHPRTLYPAQPAVIEPLGIGIERVA